MEYFPHRPIIVWRIKMYSSPMPGEDREILRARVGLCLDCCHSRHIASDRGAEFYMCTLSKTDPRFPKYPRLPVISCSGYAPENAPQVQ
jgi:hypothetical protein